MQVSYKYTCISVDLRFDTRSSAAQGDAGGQAAGMPPDAAGVLVRFGELGGRGLGQKVAKHIHLGNADFYDFYAQIKNYL